MTKAELIALLQWAPERVEVFWNAQTKQVDVRERK